MRVNKSILPWGCIFRYFSDSIYWRVEEHAPWEVGIAPLSEWCLPLEILLTCWVMACISTDLGEKLDGETKWGGRDITYKVELKMLLVVTKWVTSASRSLPCSTGFRVCSDLSIALVPFLCLFCICRDLFLWCLFTLSNLPLWIAGKLESLADFGTLGTSGESILI